MAAAAKAKEAQRRHRARRAVREETTRAQNLAALKRHEGRGRSHPSHWQKGKPHGKKPQQGATAGRGAGGAARKLRKHLPSQRPRL